MWPFNWCRWYGRHLGSKGENQSSNESTWGLDEAIWTNRGYFEDQRVELWAQRDPSWSIWVTSWHVWAQKWIIRAQNWLIQALCWSLWVWSWPIWALKLTPLCLQIGAFETWNKPIIALSEPLSVESAYLAPSQPLWAPICPNWVLILSLWALSWPLWVPFGPAIGQSEPYINPFHSRFDLLEPQVGSYSGVKQSTKQAFYRVACKVYTSN